jgi:L-fucose mutarotase
MLKGISPLLSSELVHVLMDMGHGDEIVLANANFPAHSLARRLLKADGICLTDLLAAILCHFPLDMAATENTWVIGVPPGEAEPDVWQTYETQLAPAGAGGPVRISREAFFSRARDAFAIVASGEMRLRSNIILRKGIVTDADAR